MLLPKPSYPDIHKGRQQTSSMLSVRSGDSGFVSLLQSDAWRTVHEASTSQLPTGAVVQACSKTLSMWHARGSGLPVPAAGSAHELRAAAQVEARHIGDMKFKGVAGVHTVMQINNARYGGREFPAVPPSSKAELVRPAVHALHQPA